MKVLITGATGLLGNNIARQALEKGWQVAAINRSNSQNPAFANLNIDVHSVDLTDRAAVAGVLDRGFDAVIHSAAHIHIGWRHLPEALRVNRDGTQFLVDELAKHRTKMIHVSTINTLAIGSRQQPANEETTGDGQIPSTYVVSKRAAEKVVVDAAASGQDIAIVHPGFMLGPWDWKPSSGRMIQALQGFAPLAPAGGCSVCDPRDVAAAILKATEQSVAGRHYILGGENLTYLELWRRISKQLGKRGPWTYLRTPGRWVASHVGDLASACLKRELDINSAAIGMASQFHWYSSQRAIAELGYSPRPVDDSIRDAVAWLREHQMLKAPKR